MRLRNVLVQLAVGALAGATFLACPGCGDGRRYVPPPPPPNARQSVQESELRRTPVPGGWVYDSGSYRGGVCFVADPAGDAKYREAAERGR